MSKSKIIAVLAIIFLLITLCIEQVNGTNDNPGLSDNPLSLNGLVISTEQPTETSDANQIAANSIMANQIATNQVVANSIAANSVLQPTISTTTNSDSLPQTGVTEDITVIFFIIVCAISAIYAYKKIREYNV